MKKYRVDLFRETNQHTELIVEAENELEARLRAIENATDNPNDFEWKHGIYYGPITSDHGDAEEL